MTRIFLTLCCLCIPLTAQAKRSDHSAKNKKLAQDYCKVFEKKYPKKECKVDKRICPKGWVADKKFKGRGTNYSSCVRGRKTERLKGLFTRGHNQGSAELINTKDCNKKQIEAINRTLQFARDQFSKIKRELLNPSTKRRDYFKSAYSGAFKGKGALKVSPSSKDFKTLKKYVMGEKKMQIQCRSKSWCSKRGVYGVDGLKIKHVNVCVDTIVDELSEGYLAGNLLHEIGHTARFPRAKLKEHNCSGKFKSSCPRADAVHQLGRTVDYLYMNQSKKRSLIKRVNKIKLKRKLCAHQE
jgi:hypothetical protein